jgi:Ca-activated chloride channel family protein
MDRARRAAEEILARLAPRDRAALAAFAGRGLLLTPLTPDRGALVDLLAGLDTQFIQPASSHLGDGIRAALEAFEAGSQRPRVVFVVSDGEDPDRRDLGAADAARQRVRAITVALGSEIGSHVPDGPRPLRDRGGATVVSRRRADRLARLAAETGGESFVGDEWGRIDFDRAAAAIRRDVAAAEGERVERRVRAVRVAPFATLAFVLLLVEGLPRPRDARWRARGGALVCVAVGAPLLVAGAHFFAGAARGADRDQAREGSLLATLEARVRTAPEDARAYLDLGLARLERGRSEAAARAFLAAAVYAREAGVAAVAYYDLGVAALAQGDLEAARDAFFDALAVDPSDRAARFNLEWTLQALRRRPPAPVAAPEEAEVGERDEADARPSEPEDDPREAPQDPRAEARPSEAPEPPALTAEQRRRWLERAADDPRQWLRVAAREHEDMRRRPAGPTW